MNPGDPTPEQAARLHADPQRPAYHLMPPANWMNDPNGMIYWRGQYHVFYQYHPFGSQWGLIHWGHALSTDLVHWRHLPIALTPEADAPDHDGCWSGCAVDDAGIPTLLYTGVWPETQNIATGSADLLHWQKHPHNPAHVPRPEGLNIQAFRDPLVWQQDGRWKMLLGTGIRGTGGAVLLYEGDTLTDWQFVDVLLKSEAGIAEEMWECPAFFPLGDRFVLLISVLVDASPPDVSTWYFVGSFVNNRFSVERRGVLDYGRSFYAPQTLLDEGGRRIMIGWLREARSSESAVAAGWSGCMSVPRVLNLNADSLLEISPAPELEQLRTRHFRLEHVRVDADTAGILPDIRGRRLEIMAEILPEDAQLIGLALACSADGEEQTRIIYEATSGTLSVDRTQSSHSQDASREPQQGTLKLAPDESLRLHLFVDGSTLEIFANARLCLSCRIYPTRADSDGLRLICVGGSFDLRALDVWELASIWE